MPPKPVTSYKISSQSKACIKNTVIKSLLTSPPTPNRNTKIKATYSHILSLPRFRQLPDLAILPDGMSANEAKRNGLWNMIENMAKMYDSNPGLAMAAAADLSKFNYCVILYFASHIYDET